MAVGYPDGRRAFRSSTLRNCLRRSKLELRWPRNGLNIATRSSRWSAFCACVCADAEPADETGCASQGW
eukprot:15441273-Alexandrium_andersonii.AAC.1